MDEGDDYVPQISQMPDYGMPQMAPAQQHYQPGISISNPYEHPSHQQHVQQQQQHMMMMQQHQQMAMPPQAQQSQAAPAKKPRGKSKKAQAAAAAAAQEASSMDPMASMAAMSNNPMMRQNPYPSQMPMYGGGYPGGSGTAPQGYRPVPGSGPQSQSQYPGGYSQQMYPPQQMGGPPSQSYPPGYPAYPGYPPQSSQPSHSQYQQVQRPQYPSAMQQGQQMAPGYYGNYPPSAPANPQQGASRLEQISQQIYVLEAEMNQIRQRMGKLYQQGGNAISNPEVISLQRRMSEIQSEHYMLAQQQAHLRQQYQQGQHQMTNPNYRVPPGHPSSVPSSHPHPTSISQGATNPNPPIPPGSSSQGVIQGQQQPLSSGSQPPVQVNQTGSQVQLNITADKSRTLISVYHEGYGGSGSNQTNSQQIESGASSMESKESIVPPEPIPTAMQKIAPIVKEEPTQAGGYGANVAASGNGAHIPQSAHSAYKGLENGAGNMPNIPQHGNYPPTSYPNPPTGSAPPSQQQVHSGYSQHPAQSMASSHPQYGQYPGQSMPPYDNQQQMRNPYSMPSGNQPGMMSNGGQPHQQTRMPHMAAGPPQNAAVTSFGYSPHSQNVPQANQAAYPNQSGTSYGSIAPQQPMPSAGLEHRQDATSVDGTTMAEKNQLITIQPSTSIEEALAVNQIDKAPIDAMMEDSDSQPGTTASYEERVANEEVNRIMTDDLPPDEREQETPSITRDERSSDLSDSDTNHGVNGSLDVPEVASETVPNGCAVEPSTSVTPTMENMNGVNVEEVDDPREVTPIPVKEEEKVEEKVDDDPQEVGIMEDATMDVTEENNKNGEVEEEINEMKYEPENDPSVSEEAEKDEDAETEMAELINDAVEIEENGEDEAAIDEPIKYEDDEKEVEIPKEESLDEEKEEEEVEKDDDASSVTTSKIDIDEKDGSEEPAVSEVNEGLTEPSAPATPMTCSSVGSTKKKNYKRPAVIIAKAKKKKGADESDDDDFYPDKSRSRKKGGGRKKKDSVPAFPDDEEFSVNGNPKRAATGKWADLNEEDEDDDMLTRVASTAAADPNAMIVEKILNSRMQKEEGEEEETEQFLIKWKGRAYMHCEWKNAAELEDLDKRSLGKVKRFKVKKSQSWIEDEEDFNSDYLIVDRVVDVTVEDDGQEFALIKWKSLGYEEVTWEAIETVPAEKVEVWRTRQIIDVAKLKEKPRPEANEWKKIEDTMVWKNGNTLREYQFEGVNWLLYCYYNAQNCILADEMGLGKTVQTITFLSQVYEYGVHGPFLIVVPLSTIHNWVREFETWTDMNAVVYHGSAYAREVLQQYEIYYDKKHSGTKNWKKNLVKLDALITTFETVVSDCEFIRKIPWRVCVIDEAHRLKNRNCKLLVNGLLAFRMEHRVLLTGTPLQNNIEELFSLLNFLHPQQFNSSVEFLEQFGSCQSDEQVQKLQDILKPMMLRRLKEDVEKSLGPKEETIIEVQLSDMQKKFYRAILERNFSHLCKGTSAPSLMNVMMELRKCCNHPFLINGAEETILHEFRTMHPEWDDETLMSKALVQASGKVVLIEKLLPKLRKDGHKVLIFSQMVKVLDLLEEFLVNMNYPFERIDGNVRGDLRQASIDRFSRENSDRFVFLLCTRAGGLGINLTAADTVIIFDSDWNPQNDLQAQARCHRIGQKKLVKVYRLITANTYEREMFDKASLKLGLDKAVLQSTTALKESSTALSKKDVEELLKKGAYGSIMDENNESAKFNEEDIDTILQRRTQTITLEAGQKGSLFAKATFNSTHNKGDDIDIDDPEFWTKWAEKAQVDVEKATATPDGRELILEEPRKRTKRFEDNLKDDEESDGSEGSGPRKRNGPAGSSRKRRRGDEDGDYSSSYRPDELATSKTEYFKVEKVLAQFGWGRWAEMKRVGDLEMAEIDIEHMSRTLLLHCIREFRGEDRIRQFVFQLIKPNGEKNPKSDSISLSNKHQSIYHEGWAALPEFNPPSFALDSSFQRHVHRHANKLMIKMDMLKHLETHIIDDQKSAVEDLSTNYTDITLNELPTVSETFVDGWDSDCDKCLLIGSWRHGLENYENIKNDENLCFVKKELPNWPVPAELWLRFRRLVGTSQRNVHDPVYEKLKWSKREELEFIRVLRSFGIKESKKGPGVDWDIFRTFAPSLEKKNDEECHEQLLCVLSMCNRAQGATDLKPLDLKRALSLDQFSARRAARMMNRLHLMRKVHALGERLEETDLSLCEMDGMPSGWTSQHDKELMEICDQHGIDGLAANCLRKPAFEKIVRPSERTLIRRVLEIVNTLESGKWMGAGDVDSIEDSDTEEKRELTSTTQAQARLLQQQQQATAAAAAAAAARRSRKRGANQMSDQDKMRLLMQQAMMAQGSGNASQQDMAALLLMMPQLLAASTGGASTSSSSSNSAAAAANQAAVLQLLSQLMMGSVPGATSSKSSSSQPSQADILALQQQLLIYDALAQASASTGSTKKKSSTSATPASKSVESTSAPTPSSSSVPAAASSSSSSKNQDQIILQYLTNAGVGMNELLILNALSKETIIPMMHRKTKESLSEKECPAVKDLTVWIVSNPDYVVDLNNTGKKPKGSVSKATDSTPASAKPSAPATPAPVMTPKDEKQEEKKGSATATVQVKVGMGIHSDEPIAVFNRSTGEILAATKWPKGKELSVWLDANPECNVHSTSAVMGQLILGESHMDRIGGESSSSVQPATLPSTSHTPAPPLTPSTPASMSASTSAQLAVLAAAAAAAASSTPSAMGNKSKSQVQQQQQQQQQQATDVAMAKQQQELMQMLMLQQMYHSSLAMMYPGYGMAATTSAATPSSNAAVMSAMAAAAASQAAAASTATKPSTTASSSVPTTSSSTSADEAMLLNAMLGQNPAMLQMMMDPTMLAAMSAAAAASSSTPQQSSKKSKH